MVSPVVDQRGRCQSVAKLPAEQEQDVGIVHAYQIYAWPAGRHHKIERAWKDHMRKFSYMCIAMCNPLVNEHARVSKARTILD